MENLIWVDWLLIGIVAISTLVSLVRGFIKEAFSLVTWILAFFVARSFTAELGYLLSDYISTPSIRFASAFLLLFVMTLIVGALISHLIWQLVRMTGLTATDRVLGMVFGLGRGVVIAVVLVALARLTPLPQDPWWGRSVVIERLLLIESWSRKTFGDDLEKWIRKL